MRGCSALVLGLVVTSACATDPAFRAPADERSALDGDARARRMLEGMGKPAYDAIRVISFDFVARFGGLELARSHYDWDKHAGLIRWVQGDGDDRKAVWLRIDDKSGIAFEGGARIEDDTRVRELLDEAFARWTNDTYWLVSPYKVFDPGVRRAATDDGRLRISFEEGIGLTPGDAYIYALGDDGTPVQWSFLLESGAFGTFEFRDRTDLLGATFHLKKSGLITLMFEGLSVSREPRDHLFAPLLVDEDP